MRVAGSSVVLVAMCAVPGRAQTAVATPVAIGNIVLSGSLRARSYAWGWFGDTANGDYAYPASLARLGLSASRGTFEWQAEVALPLLLHLPTTAVAAAPQGQLGLGATYSAANGNSAHAAMLFLKQGFIRLKDVGGVTGQSVKVGRLEFNDGAEVVPKNPTLAALKRDRISQRLLGTFGFTDVGRSFDGAQYTLARTNLNVTVLAARPRRACSTSTGGPNCTATCSMGP